ncbi:MAG: hypothetical protein SVM80_07650 [Halobacteriota archaeon]|nr:hypothetical protein [Halobacteriota archaeon]
MDMDIFYILVACLVFLSFLIGYVVLLDIRLRNFEKKIDDLKRVLGEGK